MRARSAREIGVALAAACLVLVLFARFADTPALRGLETASLDLRFRIRGVQAPGPDVTLVLVDDASIAAFGRWPFSRSLIAQAVQRLKEAGAKVVAFDLLFAEAERALPDQAQASMRATLQALPKGDPARPPLEKLLADDPDAPLETAMAQSGNVLLPLAFSFVGASGDAPDYLSDSAFSTFDKSARPVVFPLEPVAVLPPIERFGKAARGLGNVNIAYDRDGAVRFDRSVLPFDGDFYPSLAIRAAADYLGVPWPEVRLILGQGIQVGATLIPTDQSMRLPINFRGPPGTLPTFSFADLIGGRVPEDRLKGRVVLIGGSFTGNKDSFASPFSVDPMPGTEILATVIDMILQRDFLSEQDPPQWHAAVLGAVLVLAAGTGLAAGVLSFRTAGITGLLLIALLLAGLQAAFQRGLWLPAVQPAAALLVSLVCVLLLRYWTVDRAGQRVRSAFRRYMAPELVDVLAAHPEKLRLGGETRNMTLMFCDIRGFTAISEQFQSDPQGLTHLINRFLSPMTRVIIERRGTIDKYMGDCIMAFWNAPLDDPDHAAHGAAAALAMMTALTALNRQLADEGLRPLAIGIGLNSGECVVGNMGSDLRFDYSVLGDAVNVSSRLEGLSKFYGVAIVIGPATRAAIADWACLELDLIAVKGKTEAVHIYGLLGDRAFARSPAFVALQACHAAMLERYRACDWSGARRALDACRTIAGHVGGLCDLYEDRITGFSKDPPAADWTGVYTATSK
jgi:adenylate cyclase